jgi:hypothetical protein
MNKTYYGYFVKIEVSDIPKTRQEYKHNVCKNEKCQRFDYQTSTPFCPLCGNPTGEVTGSYDITQTSYLLDGIGSWFSENNLPQDDWFNAEIFKRDGVSSVETDYILIYPSSPEQGGVWVDYGNYVITDRAEYFHKWLYSAHRSWKLLTSFLADKVIKHEFIHGVVVVPS